LSGASSASGRFATGHAGQCRVGLGFAYAGWRSRSRSVTSSSRWSGASMCGRRQRRVTVAAADKSANCRSHTAGRHPSGPHQPQVESVRSAPYRSHP
jgi:hypothetical protein